MPEDKATMDQRNANIESVVRELNPGATTTTSSPGPGAQSPAATINQMPSQSPTQAATEAVVERLANNPGRK